MLLCYVFLLVFSGTILLFVMGQLGLYGKYLASDVFGIVEQPKLALYLTFIDRCFSHMCMVCLGVKMLIWRNL